MERDYYKDDFERLIKQKADQYRMYPSDKVWKGIHRFLHPRKWYWLGFTLLMISGLGYYGLTELISSSPDRKIADTKTKAPTIQKEAVIVPFITVTNSKEESKPSGRNLNKEKFIHSDVLIPIISSPNEFLTTNQNSEPPLKDILDNSGWISKNATSHERLEPASVRNVTKEARISTDNVPLPAFNKSLADNSDVVTVSENEDGEKINWLQEYAVHELTVPREKRIKWQLGFSPTMNYRKLTGSRYASIQSNVKNIPIALSIEGDIDNLVNHKPALGFELGSFVLYSLNRSFSVKAGLQFNYSRYDIQAYSSPAEVATIALNSVFGFSMDSITSYSMIRNFGGYAVKDLQNQYFHLSAPIGMELRLIGNKKLQLHVAGTLQPTYLLNRNSYLITTDYKNYTREPSLVRRWNVNIGAEAFVSYKTAGLQWQVGPQFRYQLFSSYSSQYPVKEYLMEYGVKIGITKTIR